MLEENKIRELLDEIIYLQAKKVVDCAQQFYPNITPEDVMQAFDYPDLEANPHFRYEEGILEGMHTVRSAMLAYLASV